MPRFVNGLIQRLFSAVEKVFHLNESRVFRYNDTVHKGKEIILADGTRVAKDSELLELHLDNEFVQELKGSSRSDGRFAVQLLSEIRVSLVATARYVDQYGNIIAICAGTPRRFTPITERCGFESREMPKNFKTWAIGWLQRLAFEYYDPKGYKEARQGDPRDLDPVEIWMSKKALEQYMK